MRGRRSKRRVGAAVVDLDLTPAPLSRTALAVVAVCLLFASGTAAPSSLWKNPSFTEAAETADSPRLDNTAAGLATSAASLATPYSPAGAAAVPGGVTPSRPSGDDGTVAERGGASRRNLGKQSDPTGAADNRYWRATQETDK